jgi:putative ribosome biogenesis GTPase RsgA
LFLCIKPEKLNKHNVKKKDTSLIIFFCFTGTLSKLWQKNYLIIVEKKGKTPVLTLRIQSESTITGV